MINSRLRIRSLLVTFLDFWSLLGKDEGVYIDGEAAVDGKARVGKVDTEPLEGLDGDASAIIEVMDTAARSDGVCMIYGCGI